LPANEVEFKLISVNRVSTYKYFGKIRTIFVNNH
jgi:hypothetical protein